MTRADRGNTRAFSCNYHGWAFGLDGSLVTVPLESEVYFNEIDKNQFRLVPVERVDSYHGLIFGCFDKDAPSLADYLGDMRWYLDVALDAMPGGTELLGATQKVIIHSNWKLSVENVCGDGYHLGWSHGGALKATQSGDFSGFTVGNSSVDLEGGMSVAGLNGNSVLATLDGVSGYAFYPNPTLALKYLSENRAKAVERLGKWRGENRKEFECPYHRWLFSLDGKLTACPGSKEFAPDFKQENFGLMELKSAQFMGIVFVTMGKNTPPLTEWLGDIVPPTLSTLLGGDGRLKLLGYQKVRYGSNWKGYNDNDGYHAPMLHTAFRLLNWQGGTTGFQRMTKNGHVVFEAELKAIQNNGFVNDPSLVEFKGSDPAKGSRIVQFFPQQ